MWTRRERPGFHTFEHRDQLHVRYEFARTWDGVYFSVVDGKDSSAAVNELYQEPYVEILPDVFIVTREFNDNESCTFCHRNCQYILYDIRLDHICDVCKKCFIKHVNSVQSPHHIPNVCINNITNTTVEFEFDRDYFNIMRDPHILQAGELCQYDSGNTIIGCPVCKNTVTVDRGRKIGDIRFTIDPTGNTIIFEDVNRFKVLCQYCHDTRARILLCFRLTFLPRELRYLIIWNMII